MQSVFFEGSTEIKKPESMTDEQCMSVWAERVQLPAGKDKDGADLVSIMWIEHFMPSLEDIEAINAGRGIWVQLHIPRLFPHAVFTLNENNESNDAG